MREKDLSKKQMKMIENKIYPKSYLNQNSKFQKTSSDAEGITLIALIITIILMLILAGVTVSIAINGGLFKVAKGAESNTQIEIDREQLQTSVIGAYNIETGEVDFEKLEGDLSDWEIDANTGKCTSSKGNSFLVDEDGNVNIYIDRLGLKVGDYVNYNPMVSDKNGTKVNETYTSQVGNGKSSGNGKSIQEFIVQNNTSWRVLNINTDGTVEIISTNVLGTGEVGTTFELSGKIGYLYLEEELNKACSIYGYGYGADKTKVSEYTVGGPKDERITKQITGSGARSIKIEDINKIAGYQQNNLEDVNTVDFLSYYPTVTTDNASSENKDTGWKNNFYSFSKNEIEDVTIRNILFNGENYYLASQCLNAGSNFSYFCIRSVLGTTSYHVDIGAELLCGCYDEDCQAIFEKTPIGFGIRPIVTLMPNVIDLKNIKKDGLTQETAWDLK